MRSKLLGVATAAMSVGLATAACGSSGTSASDAPPSHSPAVAPASANGTFGTACAEVPASGMGSLSGMAGAPVATAASHNPLLSDLVHAVRVAGLTNTFNSERAITVFAPENGAFTTLGSGNVNTLLASKADLRKVLEYHVVRGRITPADLASGAKLTTLLGTELHPTVQDGVYKINNATVVCGNVQTGNATVYIIDKLLIP
jgi:uncharacterized surface protein with fasciclin (FAS1) repeats